MDHATFVVFASKTKRSRLRDRLKDWAGETVRFTERKGLGGSEFAITGPPALAREAHEAAVRWLAKAERDH